MLLMLVIVLTLASIAYSESHPVVSQRTPRARQGDSRPINVVGIGDSVASGANCDCESFVGLYAAALASKVGRKTTSENLAIDGGTSSDLLRSLTQPGSVRDQVAKADVLLVTIGANDLQSLESMQPAACALTCYSPLVKVVGHNVELIVAAVRTAQPDYRPMILVTDYWNVFPDGDVGLAENGRAFQDWSDTLTRADNEQICAGARHAGAICVDLYAPFKKDGSKNPTSLLAADGDHPNSAGHQVIASTLLANTPSAIP